MFFNIFLFELKYQFRRPVIYIFWGILLALAFLVGNLLGGAFESVPVFLGGDKVFINSPYFLHQIQTNIAFILMILYIPIFGRAVERDFQFNFHPLLFTTPVKKFSYLFGRFTAAFLINSLIWTGMMVGFMLAYSMPWLNELRVGPFILMGYIQPYLTHILPNSLFMGAIFFATATLVRNTSINYLLVVAFMVLFSIAGSYMKDLDNVALTSMMDPLGDKATNWLTKYWTPSERNTKLVTLSGWLLANRLMWTAVGFGLLALVYFKFKFSQTGPSLPSFKKKPILDDDEDFDLSVIKKIVLPKLPQDFSLRNQFRQFSALASSHFKSIFKTWYFAILMLIGIIFLFISAPQIGKMYGTTTYPVTYAVTSQLVATFSLFILIITILAAGELVWRERGAKMGQIYDALALPNWVTFASKLSALFLLQVVLVTVVLVCGLIVQAAKGYTNFELWVYIQELYIYNLPNLMLLALLTYVIQVIVNQKYLAYFITALYYLWTATIEGLVLQDNLFSFASDPGVTYSDMNGYGHFVWGFFVFKAYWGVFAIFLSILANLLLVRGTETSLKSRLKTFKLRFNRKMQISMVGTLLVFMSIGGYIYYNTHVLNEFSTSKTMEEKQVEHELTYKKWEKMVQPKITSVVMNLDLYPSKRALSTNGTFMLKNKSTTPIDSVVVFLDSEIEIQKMEMPGATEVFSETDFGYHIYEFVEPLKPGDSLPLEFEFSQSVKGFPNSAGGLGVTYNGTFINNNSFLPSLGYSDGFEMSSNTRREEYDLPRKRIALPRTDKGGAQRNLFVRDADFIHFETTISTEPDQIAIAPGYLQKEWEEDGRKYFHYKMDSPIMKFFSFLSGRYEVKRDNWNDVPIEIYYHKGHEYNLEQMIKAVKMSLDYYTENFSPYQHRQVRILEFPRYATFAQSFPNTIPFSEGIGFIADVSDAGEEEDGGVDFDGGVVDYPFYVTAHEVAHQWWAHQVIGGNVEGSNMLSETLSQYAALMVMKTEYGPYDLKKFLKFEMNSYLMGRSNESEGEKPLARAHQGHILYRKGAVVMFGLQDYIGEDSLNLALQRYIDKVAFQSAPYTNTLEFVEEIRKVTPDSMAYIVDDWFEDIILYDNQVEDAVYRREEDMSYTVDFVLTAKKLRADSLGVEEQLPINDYIEMVVFDDADSVLYAQKHKVNREVTKYRIHLDRKPAKVGVDPFYKLIDRNLRDNVTDAKIEGGEDEEESSEGGKKKQKGGMSLKVN